MEIGVGICELTKGIPYVFEALMLWDIKTLQKLVKRFFWLGKINGS